MKHLVAKEHHPHLKKRAILELFGLSVLIALCIHQRELISIALQTLRSSDLFYVLLMFALYWLLLPLTSISYRLLANRKLPLGTTVLAQMAAAGPGRIIPGGLGHISIGAVHLSKYGIPIQKALMITISNNLIGLFTTMAFVVFAVVYHPNLIDTITRRVSIQSMLVVFLSIVVLVSLFLWLSHLRSTRKTFLKLHKHGKILLWQLIRNPHRLILLLFIASLILFGHVSILLLSGEALGVHISIIDGLIALSVGVVIGGAVPTPGGIGAVEAGIISALILLGYEPAIATSIALLFRTATYWQPLIPGVLAYLYLRERKLL